ncbi:MAG: glycosyltransferase [Acidobacteria bacterium]|nr:glycosyltransferase [Acidobacteriota bacterium]
MKILWVKPGKLLPLDTGGKLRTYNILRQLSLGHQLTYLSYYGGTRDENYEREVQEHLPGTITIHAPTADSPLGRYLDYGRRFFWRAPYAVSRFTDPRVLAQVTGWFEERRFDVAVCDFLASALNFPRRLSIPTVLFQHNVESVLWQRRADFESKWLDRTVAKIESAKMDRFEPEQVRRFHHVIAVSEQDRQAMSGMCGGERISVVPTGVDLAKYQYDPTVRPSGPLVVFTGSMDWGANVDGVEYFCQGIWPRVLAQVPQARFRIVGRDPHPRVKKLASATVEVTGTVPSIVDHLREAAVLVVPLRIGSGTRIKIYEGMAMGKATVSTTVGAEGLDVQHQRDILLEDTAEGFAQAVVLLLQNADLRRKYEAAAAATARQYDWSVIADRFVEVLDITMRAAASGRASA